MLGAVPIAGSIPATGWLARTRACTASLSVAASATSCGLEMANRASSVRSRRCKWVGMTSALLSKPVFGWSPKQGGGGRPARCRTGRRRRRSCFHHGHVGDSVQGQRIPGRDHRAGGHGVADLGEVEALRLRGHTGSARHPRRTGPGTTSPGFASGRSGAPLVEVSRTASLIGSKTAFGLPREGGVVTDAQALVGRRHGAGQHAAVHVGLVEVTQPVEGTEHPVQAAHGAGTSTSPRSERATVDVPLSRIGVSKGGPLTPGFRASVGRLEMLAACVSRLAEPGVAW